METLAEDIHNNDDFIEPDIMFDHIMPYNSNSKFEDKIMIKVEKLLEEKDKKITELEKEILDIKKYQNKLKVIINYMVKYYHDDSSGIKNIQPIYDNNGIMIDCVVNEGWVDRRIPLLIKENGSLKRYKLDGKIYEMREKGVVVEIT